MMITTLQYYLTFEMIGAVFLTLCTISLNDVMTASTPVQLTASSINIRKMHAIMTRATNLNLKPKSLCISKLELELKNISIGYNYTPIALQRVESINKSVNGAGVKAVSDIIGLKLE